MATTEGLGGQPPSAWVWSQYRGVLPAESAAAPASVPAPKATTDAPRAGAKHGLIGLGVAAAVILIAGLTWLFTTRTASGPAPEATPPAATEGGQQKSESAPPAADPAPAAAQAPAPAAPAPAAEAPKASTPAAPHPGGEHGKKKKKHQG